MADLPEQKITFKCEAILALLAVLLLLANYTVLIDLWNKWFASGLTGPFAHGPLLAILATRMIFLESKVMNKPIACFSSYKLITLFTLITLCLFVSLIIDIDFLEHIFVLSLLTVLFWLVYPIKFQNNLIYPLLLLIFTLPVWGSLEQLLQLAATHLSNLLLSITTIPFYREGYLFYFPNGIIEVAEACSGLQQLLVSITLGTIYAYQKKMQIITAARLLLYLVCFAIVINVIRIVVIMLIGYYTKMTSSIVEDHFVLGWLIYAIGITFFFILYDKYIRAREQHTTRLSNPSHFEKAHKIKQTPSWPNVSLLLFLIMLPYGASTIIITIINSKDKPNSTYILNELEYQVQSSGDGEGWKIKYPGGDNHVKEKHKFMQQSVYFTSIRYKSFQPSIEPINMENKFYDTKNWKIIKTEPIRLTDFDGEHKDLNLDILVSKKGEKMIVLGWLEVDGQRTQSIVTAKIYMLLSLLKFKHDIKVVVIATPYESENGIDIQILHKYYSNLFFKNE